MTNTPFDVSESVDRMKMILGASDRAFEKRDSIPDAESLTFDTGFDVQCSALVIDIRDSSRLPERYTRPVLAKIYGAYISECAKVMDSDLNCRKIDINGDSVTAVLNTRSPQDINTAFESAAKLNSLVMTLNWQLEKNGISPIRCGIGLAYGRALMRKVGLKGYAINEVVWMGDVVNEASNLCNRGSKDGNAPVQVSSAVYGKLTEKYKSFLKPQLDLDPPAYRYEGHVVNEHMEQWLVEQKEKEHRDTQIHSLMDSIFASTPLPPPSGGLAGLLPNPLHSGNPFAPPPPVPAYLGSLFGPIPTPPRLGGLMGVGSRPTPAATALSISLSRLGALAYPPEREPLGVFLSRLSALAYPPKR